MHTEQQVYISAVASLELALELVQKHSPVWTYEETEEEFAAKDALEEALYERYCIAEKQTAVFSARRKLWAWAKETVEREMADAPNLSEALAAFDLVRGNNRAADKLTELCLSLRVG